MPMSARLWFIGLSEVECLLLLLALLTLPGQQGTLEQAFQTIWSSILDSSP